MIAVLGLLLFSGCGGGGGSTQSTAAPESSQQAKPQSAEASIEGFGEEAEGVERKAILASLDDYLEALSKKDYGGACARMDAKLHESLEQLTGKKGVECAKALPLFLSPEAADASKTQLEGVVTKVRVKGEEGFVVFKAPGARLYDMAMVEEGGEWKVGAASADVLVPEL